MAKDISARVLKIAGHNMLINEHYEDAFNFYEKSNSFQEDKEAKFFMAVAYYKAGRVKNNPQYTQKALSLLEELKKTRLYESEANYYLVLIYSDIKELKALRDVIAELEDSIFEERGFVAGNETYIAKKNKEKKAEEGKIIDPVLEEIYNFLYPYMKEYYNLKNEKEIEEKLRNDILNFYKEIMRKKGKINLISLSIAIILALLRDKKTAYRFLEITEMHKTIRPDFIDSLPVFTKHVVKQFLKRMGISFEANEPISIPYIAERKKDIAMNIIEVFNSFNKEKNIEHLREGIEKALPYDYGKNLMPLYEDIKSQRAISKLALEKSVKLFTLSLLKELKKQLSLFYNKRQVSFILRTIISDLNIEEKDKIELAIKLDI